MVMYINVFAEISHERYCKYPSVSILSIFSYFCINICSWIILGVIFSNYVEGSQLI